MSAAGVVLTPEKIAMERALAGLDLDTIHWIHTAVDTVINKRNREIPAAHSVGEERELRGAVAELEKLAAYLRDLAGRAYRAQQAQTLADTVASHPAPQVVIP